MSRPVIACAIALTLVLAPSLRAEDPPATPAPPAGPQDTTPRIDVVLLLDTSNSMDGLINQARTQLWKIVNEFEAVRRNGERPIVRVALYEYGNQGLSSESGYIRQVLPLTTNLDKISEELFALTTNGGDEYCGQVIARAVEQLEWSEVPGSMHCIFIAGNEPFTQGPVDYKEACKSATSKNITISTIHCGTFDEGVSGMWADGAKISDGEYFVIDQNKIEPGIEAPQDEQLAELSAELNKTYIAYGNEKTREDALGRQVAQDANAAKAAPAAAASRAFAKASANYRNSAWDLLDAVREQEVDLLKLKKDELPEELRELSDEELQAHVDKKQAERAELQAKIKELSAARRKFIAAERAKLAETAGESLDEVVNAAVRDQAIEEGFEYVEEE